MLRQALLSSSDIVVEVDDLDTAFCELEARAALATNGEHALPLALAVHQHQEEDYDDMNVNDVDAVAAARPTADAAESTAAETDVFCGSWSERTVFNLPDQQAEGNDEDRRFPIGGYPSYTLSRRVAFSPAMMQFLNNPHRLDVRLETEYGNRRRHQKARDLTQDETPCEKYDLFTFAKHRDDLPTSCIYASTAGAGAVKTEEILPFLTADIRFPTSSIEVRSRVVTATSGPYAFPHYHVTGRIRKRVNKGKAAAATVLARPLPVLEESGASATTKSNQKKIAIASAVAGNATKGVAASSTRSSATSSTSTATPASSKSSSSGGARALGQEGGSCSSCSAGAESSRSSPTSSSSSSATNASSGSGYYPGSAGPPATAPSGRDADMQHRPAGKKTTENLHNVEAGKAQPACADVATKDVFEFCSRNAPNVAFQIPTNECDVCADTPSQWNKDLPLRDDQKRTLAWMQSRERSAGTPTAALPMLYRRFVPLERLGDDAVVGKEVDDGGVTRRFLEIEATAHFPVLGGILADETGYGKTVTTLALIASDADAAQKTIATVRVPDVPKSSSRASSPLLDLDEECEEVAGASSENTSSLAALGGSTSSASSRNGKNKTWAVTKTSGQAVGVAATAPGGPGDDTRKRAGGNKGGAAGAGADKANTADPHLDCPTTTLIVTPPHILKQWADEAERFRAPGCCPKVLQISTVLELERLFSSTSKTTGRAGPQAAGQVKKAESEPEPMRKRRKQENDPSSVDGAADRDEEGEKNPFSKYSIVLVSNSVLLNPRYLEARAEWERRIRRQKCDGRHLQEVGGHVGAAGGRALAPKTETESTSSSALLATSLPLTVNNSLYFEGSPTVMKMLALRKRVLESCSKKTANKPAAATSSSSAVSSSSNKHLLKPFHAFRWRRIVFDEFHEALIELQKKTARDIEENSFFLCDFHTAQTPLWALTGTPDVHRVFDVEVIARIFGVDLLGVSHAGATALQELHYGREDLGVIGYRPDAADDEVNRSTLDYEKNIPLEELMPRFHDVENGTPDGWVDVAGDFRMTTFEEQLARFRKNCPDLRKIEKQARQRAEERCRQRAEEERSYVYQPDRFAKYHYRPAGRNYKYLKLSQADAWCCHLCGETPTSARLREVREHPERFLCENCGLDSHHWTLPARRKNLFELIASWGAAAADEADRFGLVRTVPYFKKLHNIKKDWDRRTSSFFTHLGSLADDKQLVREVKRTTKARRDEDVPNFTVPLFPGSVLDASGHANMFTVDEQKCYVYPQDNVARKREYFVRDVLFPLRPRCRDSLHPFDRSRIWRKNAQSFLSTFARRNAAVGVEQIVLDERRVVVELTKAEKAFYLMAQEHQEKNRPFRATPGELLEDRRTLLRLCSHFGKVDANGAAAIDSLLLSPAEACARELRQQQRTVKIATDVVCAVIRVLDYLAKSGRLQSFASCLRSHHLFAENSVREQIGKHVALKTQDDEAYKNRHKDRLFLPPHAVDALQSIVASPKKKPTPISSACDEHLHEEAADPVRSAITHALGDTAGSDAASSPFPDDSAMKTFLGRIENRVQKMTEQTQLVGGRRNFLLQNAVTTLQKFVSFTISVSDRNGDYSCYFSRSEGVKNLSSAEQLRHDLRAQHGKIMTYFSKCLTELHSTAAKLQFFKKVSKDDSGEEKANAGEGDRDSTNDCDICLADDLAPKELVVLTSCGHRFCAECVKCLVSVGKASASGSASAASKTTCKKCPTCRTVFKDPDQVVPLLDAQKVAKSAEAGKLGTTRFAKKTDSVRKLDDFSVFGTKIKTIAETILSEKAKDAGAKFIVFVQFESLLEILRKCFAAFGLNFVTLVGATPQQQAKFLTNFQKESAAVRNFAAPAGPSNSSSSSSLATATSCSSFAAAASSSKASNEDACSGPPGGNASSLLLSKRGEIGENPDILLMSLNKNAAGANLTQASHVIFVHPMCGDLNTARAAEMQAIARARRFGQKRKKVVVYRFVARGTVEEELSAEHESAIAQQREADRKMREGAHIGRATAMGGASARGEQESVSALKRRKVEAPLS